MIEEKSLEEPAYTGYWQTGVDEFYYPKIQIITL
jgi:hypothetical protein